MPKVGFEPTIAVGERPQTARPLGPAVQKVSRLNLAIKRKNQIKGGEMGRTCGMYGGEENLRRGVWLEDVRYRLEDLGVDGGLRGLLIGSKHAAGSSGNGHFFYKRRNYQLLKECASGIM